MYSRDYLRWLNAQTPERQAASLASMDAARRLGEAQRAAPFSAETKALSAQIAAYYAEHK